MDLVSIPNEKAPTYAFVKALGVVSLKQKKVTDA
jgi:hypothetical protein